MLPLGKVGRPPRIKAEHDIIPALQLLAEWASFAWALAEEPADTRELLGVVLGDVVRLVERILGALREGVVAADELGTDADLRQLVSRTLRRVLDSPGSNIDARDVALVLGAAE